MKGLKCFRLTKFSSILYFACSALLLCFFVLSPLFGSSRASAFELTSNVWRVTYASVPQFQVKLAGLRWPDWTTEPYQIGSNALIEEIAIKGNAGSANANGFTWKAGDFFSIDLAFYSSSDGCDNSFSGSFSWFSSATEVMQSRLIGSYNNADVCYTQWNVITSTWSDGSGIIDLVPQEMFSNRGNAAVIVSAVSLWRYTGTGSGGGSFDDSGMISAIEDQSKQQHQDSLNQLEELKKQTEQQQDQYDKEKEEESDRENQQQEEVSGLTGLFSFPNILNPLDGFFDLFRDGGCVSIPTLSGWFHTNSTNYCSWFPQSIRTVLTPVFGIVGVMLVFGFVVRWLGGSEAVTFEGGR